MSYFNEDQEDHLRYLASLSKEEKCDCGWARRGDCLGACWGDEGKGSAPKRTDEKNAPPSG